MAYHHPNPMKKANYVDCLPISSLAFYKNEDGETDVEYRWDRPFSFRRVLFLPKVRVDAKGNEELKIYCSYQKDGKWVLEHAYINLTSTPCNFGGLRRWFVCLCDRRIASLYFLEGEFGCHVCHRLTYETRTETIYTGWPSREVQKLIKINRKIDKIKGQIKKRTYKGRLTRKQVRYEELLNEWMLLNCGDAL